MEIEDSRRNFKTITISNYKKSNVIKELEKSIYYHKTEEAFFWTGQLLCSGFIIELWNLYIYFICKYIHIHNPKIPLYLYKKFSEFKELANHSSDDFELRNIHEIRVILFSITQILSECKKDTTLDTLKFVFNFEEVFKNLKAPNVDYVKPYFKDGDPKELFISLNEFVYHLVETKSKIDILYWIDWIIGYDEMLQKKKKPIFCESRDFIKSKHLNIIWILFEIFFSFKEPVVLTKVIESLFELFTIKYTPQSNKKKKYILNYCVMLIITDNIDFNKPIIENTGVFAHLKDNIELIFSQIKKSEVIE
jgi:hypothetical protein